MATSAAVESLEAAAAAGAIAAAAAVAGIVYPAVWKIGQIELNRRDGSLYLCKVACRLSIKINYQFWLQEL